MTAAGKVFANEPSWCCLVTHQSAIGRHFSTPLSVGDSRRDGQVRVRLARTGHGPTRLVVSAAHMAAVSADLSLTDAVALRDHLTRLLELAGHE